MIGDHDVDAVPGRLFDLRAAARPAVGGHDQRPSIRRGPLDRPERQAVAVGESLGRVGGRVQAQAPERYDEDREPGKAVGVEVAVHEDAFAPCPGRRHPQESGLGIGEQPRIV